MNPQPLSSWILYFDSFFIWLDWFSRHNFYLQKGPTDAVFLELFQPLMISAWCFHTQRKTWPEIQFLGDRFLPWSFIDAALGWLLEDDDWLPLRQHLCLCWTLGHTAPPNSLVLSLGESLTRPHLLQRQPASSGASLLSPLYAMPGTQPPLQLKMTAEADPCSSPTALRPSLGSSGGHSFPSSQSLSMGTRRYRAISSSPFPE